ncbi:M10 family metallopeptidase C-terminal domain-containing protein [Arsenophonus sp.]|uniref:calcium-binding protein n=1 Tax=Arsenophonus sp. TaxID=1872640 RepID=UPI002864B032|nr:M10 family metallopeptidase C-terminal domain-containing protein [Arsenophonus sp.]MDR5617492.1 M10 family metallopeptidase C-terminal domain-containing protein [Arsenophonus sp.]
MHDKLESQNQTKHLINGIDSNNILLKGDAKSYCINGSEGNNIIKGGPGFDWLYGREGNDKIYGEEGDDFISGDEGDDKLYGNDGHDDILGAEGDDIIEGGNGPDSLYGGSGNDKIDGGDGDDRIIGGPGADKLTGGIGKDLFSYNSVNDSTAESPDRITDFQSGIDIINLYGVITDDKLKQIPIKKVDKFTGNINELLLNYDESINETSLMLDHDGDGLAEFKIDIVGRVDFDQDISFSIPL